MPHLVQIEGESEPEHATEASNHPQPQTQSLGVASSFPGYSAPETIGQTRQVLASHYGLGGVRQQTLTQIAQGLGISKERVRQIADGARAKLRKWAHLEGLEPLEVR